MLENFNRNWLNLTKAIGIAYAAHRDQKDKGGVPYMFHVMRVGIALLPDVDAAMVGILHDVVEDGPPIAVRALEADMPRHIMEAVLAVSHRKGEPYDDYIERVALNPIATRVKLSDLADNMRPDRVASALAAGQSWAYMEELHHKYTRARRRLDLVEILRINAEAMAVHA